jgi:hypothetical protein
MMKLNLIAAAAPLALVITLAGCNDGSGSGATSSATPTPTPTATAAALDVTPCLNQLVAGRSVASLFVPDVITLDLAKPSGFPNGRRMQDPVIDLELAALFLDLKTDPVDTLAKLPLNPSGNDKPLLSGFPFLADAWGGAPAAVGGTGFVFRTDPATSYTRVDRAGEPAVSTALIEGNNKNLYNDDTPAIDATGKWVPVLTKDLTALATALDPQLTSLGLKVCAVPVAK